jgi:hypothetical protein
MGSQCCRHRPSAGKVAGSRAPGKTYRYLADVEELQELPDVPQNPALPEYLREQASPPIGPDDYTLGAGQLHTHPDLIAALRELAPG